MDLGADGGPLDMPQIVFFYNFNASRITLVITPFKASLRIWHRLKQWDTSHSQRG